MSIDERYVAARQIALKAGALARNFFAQRGDLAIEAKGRQDFVSHADRAVEQFIRGEIEGRFPGDAFLGEETAATFSGSEDRVWVVDPIDGTHNFLRGVRYYCVSIAYVERGRCKLGVVHDPEHDEMFHAMRGHGAWSERAGTEARLHVSGCASLTEAFVCLGHHDRRPEPRYMMIRQLLMDRGAAMRNMGAGALQLAHVAAGRYDAFVELSLSAWDALAGLLLVEEAEGYAAPFPGPGGLRQPGPALGCAKGLAAELAPLVAAMPS